MGERVKGAGVEMLANRWLVALFMGLKVMQRSINDLSRNLSKNFE